MVNAWAMFEAKPSMFSYQLS